jgi:hypothetical protein
VDNDGQLDPEGHIPPAIVAFQSNRTIRRYQVETYFLCANRFYARKNALAKIHLLVASATVGTHLNPNAYLGFGGREHRERRRESNGKREFRETQRT